MYLCIMVIDFVSFHYFIIGLLNCCDSVVFLFSFPYRYKLIVGRVGSRGWASWRGRIDSGASCL